MTLEYDAAVVALVVALEPGRWSLTGVPGVRVKGHPMSENTVNAALRGLGFDADGVTGHEFCATARTILDEVLEYPAHLIEHQLAHSVRDPLGRAYNRTARLPQRREMMQRWANYLHELKDGAMVISFQSVSG